MESQNFEEINTAKLSIGEGEGVLLIIWDYFHDVVIKHLLDDVSQVGKPLQLSYQDIFILHSYY